MSSKFKAVIAFSGGLESTYLAQMMLEQDHDVDLFYTNACGILPCQIEASFVYRCFEKLKDLFPNRKVRLFYMNNHFFGTHHNDRDGRRILHTNQAMRIACLLVEVQKLEEDAVYMCGWTGAGTIESSLNPGAYSDKQYKEMKQLPITLNQYTRLSIKPSPILTPLWGMSKEKVYSCLHADLREVVVLNIHHGRISSSKINEWKDSDLPLPSYVEQFISEEINWKDIINEFGLYFAPSNVWVAWIKHVNGIECDYSHASPIYYASPRTGHENYPMVPLSMIKSSVNDFQYVFTEYFNTLNSEKSNVR